MSRNRDEVADPEIALTAGTERNATAFAAGFFVVDSRRSTSAPSRRRSRQTAVKPRQECEGDAVAVGHRARGPCATPHRRGEAPTVPSGAGPASTVGYTVKL